MKSFAFTRIASIGAALALSFTSIAQQTPVSIDGLQFVHKNDKWQLIDATTNDAVFLDESTLTVKFSAAATPQQVDALEAQHQLTLIRKNILGYCDYQLSAGADVFAVYRALRNTAEIDKLEFSLGLPLFTAPNDSEYGSQWYLPQIRAEQAWDITTGDPNVVIAVLDQGADWSHEDIGLGNDTYQGIYLRDAEDDWSNVLDPATGDHVDNDANSYTDDWKGWYWGLYPALNPNNPNHQPGNNTRPYFSNHGTMVQGIINAKTNNGVGIAGIAGGWGADGCKALICKVGAIGNIPSANIDDAILYAVESGAKVINMSFGGGPVNSSVTSAIDYAISQDVVVIAAAGNSTTSVAFPASYPPVIAVGASDQNDEKTSFSNFGSELDISAPGIDMLTTEKSWGSTHYIAANGTSYSAPLVSGVVGLMLSVNPCLNPMLVDVILKRSSEKTGAYNYYWDANHPGHSQEMGYGRLDAYMAVRMAQRLYTMGLPCNINMPKSASESSITSSISNHQQFLCFPNPAKNQIQYSLKENQAPTSAYIQDIQGKTLGLIPHNNTFDVSMLERGLYFIVIESADGKMVSKFIKE